MRYWGIGRSLIGGDWGVIELGDWGNGGLGDTDLMIYINLWQFSAIFGDLW